MKTEPETLSPADRQALELAISTARKHSPAHQQQIDDKLMCEPWFVVATFAAYCCQSRALNLKPWQWPPCDVEPNDADLAGLEHRGISDSARLLRRLVASGLSKYEPAPLEALARIGRAA
jgi:hypothetical protein